MKNNINVYKFRGTQTKTEYNEKSGRAWKPNVISKRVEVEAASRDEALWQIKALLRRGGHNPFKDARTRGYVYTGKAPLVEITGTITEIGYKAGRPAGSPPEILDIFEFTDSRKMTINDLDFDEPITPGE